MNNTRNVYTITDIKIGDAPIFWFIAHNDETARRQACLIVNNRDICPSVALAPHDMLLRRVCVVSHDHAETSCELLGSVLDIVSHEMKIAYEKRKASGIEDFIDHSDDKASSEKDSN